MKFQECTVVVNEQALELPTSQESSVDCFNNLRQETMFTIGNGCSERGCKEGCSYEKQGPGLPLVGTLVNGSNQDVHLYTFVKQMDWIPFHCHPRVRYQWLETLMLSLESQNLQDEEDTLVWKWGKTGDFTVRNFYDHLKKLATNDVIAVYKFLTKLIWKTKLPQRNKLFFFWKMFLNRLPTAGRLVGMNILSSAACVLCQQGSETVNHLFSQCPVVMEVWGELLWPLAGRGPNPTTAISVKQMFSSWPQVNASELVTCLLKMVPYAVCVATWEVQGLIYDSMHEARLLEEDQPQKT